MEATEAKRKLCKLRSSLRDKEADKAIWIAIRAIDTCTKKWIYCRRLNRYKNLQTLHLQMCIFVLKNWRISNE